MKREHVFNGGRVNTTQLLASRSYYDIEPIIRRRMQSASQFMRRLDKEAILEGHDGCVNRLEWNSSGRILASVSDDTHVMLWDPFRRRRLADLQTMHAGNIFAVRFMPNTADRRLVTGAADCKVYMCDVERGGESPVWKCSCHQLRVKSIAVSPDNSDLLWTSAEDGKVFQFDLRERHVCNGDENIVFLNLNCHIGIQAEVKSIAINPRRTEMLAVGANDSYARIYDRRMLSLTKMAVQPVVDNPAHQIEFGNQNYPVEEDNVPIDSATYFSPGHFANHVDKILSMHKAITHLTFSPDGNELLVNMGAEQIYLYDLNHTREPVFVHIPGSGAPASTARANQSFDTKSTVTPAAEKIKRVGNSLLSAEKFMQAIQKYSAAILLAPNYPVLYLNRATALMRRNWYGDMYAALRDCIVAVRLDPTYIKAHFRLSRALLHLGYAKEAGESLDAMVKQFPDYEENAGVSMLRRDINSATSTQTAKSNSDESSPSFPASEKELQWRNAAHDYEERFVGHCNTTTDIKEASFFGSDGNYIVAGSDDGNFFIWERTQNVITKILRGDISIVNCVQPHPYMCLLATSGIGSEVCLWSPQPVDGETKTGSFDEAVHNNQLRMQNDPFQMGEICMTS